MNGAKKLFDMHQETILENWGNQNHAFPRVAWSPDSQGVTDGEAIQQFGRREIKAYSRLGDPRSASWTKGGDWQEETYIAIKIAVVEKVNYGRLNCSKPWRILGLISLTWNIRCICSIALNPRAHMDGRTAWFVELQGSTFQTKLMHTFPIGGFLGNSPKSQSNLYLSLVVYTNKASHTHGCMEPNLLDIPEVLEAILVVIRGWCRSGTKPHRK